MRMIAFYTPSSIRQIRRFPFTSFGPAGFVVPARRQSENRTWWRRGGDEERQGESFGTDFTNKCRRLNPGMLQDGSLSLNHRLPAASTFHLASRRIVLSYRRDVHRPFLRFALPTSPLRPSRRRFHLREWFPSSGYLGNLPHAYAAATLSLSLPHPVVVASQILCQ